MSQHPPSSVILDAIDNVVWLNKQVVFCLTAENGDQVVLYFSDQLNSDSSGYLLQLVER